jgi:hypothetical protein
MSNTTDGGREKQVICPFPSGEQPAAESGPLPLAPHEEEATSSSLPSSPSELLASVQVERLKELVKKKDRVLEEVIGLTSQVDSLMGVLIANTAQRGRDYK